MDITEQFPDIPEVGSFALVQITSLITPVHFFVRFPYGPVRFDDILRGMDSNHIFTVDFLQMCC